MRERVLVMLAWAVLVVAPLGCSGSKEAQKKDQKKDQAEGSEEDDADFLDDPVDVKRADRRKPAQSGEVFIPTAPAEPALPIDGEASGWDLKKARSFGGKEHVEDGARFWSGDSDASLRVAVESDEGFLYFWLEVKDDTIIEERDDRGEVVDGVVLWLRDPKLERLAERLPPGVEASEDLVTDFALVFTPDGLVKRHDGFGDEFEALAVQSVPFKSSGGWGVEVAIALEALPHLYSLPLTEVAFRVEQLDGDEPKRPGVQTLVSMLPRASKGAPRYAKLGTGGVLPHRDAQGGVATYEPLGYWTREAQAWSYTSLEVVPRYWRYLEAEDAEGFEEALRSSKTLRELCNTSRNDMRLFSPMQSRSGKHRVGLMLCAAREVRGRCKGDARSKLYWVHMTPAGDGWELEEHADVYDGELKQCEREALEGEPLYENFSMMPLDFISTDIWAVGWTRSLSERGYREEIEGSWLFDARRGGSRSAALVSRKVIADGDTRTLSTTRSYFVAVDDVSGYDLCEVEDLEEQDCRGFDSRCETRRHGKTRLTHIKLWVPDAGVFEPYMLSKHPGCKATNFRFAEREGYMLLHTGGRVGLLPSVANSQ